MLKKLTVGQKLWLLFGTSFIVIATFIGQNLYTSNRLTHDLHDIGMIQLPSVKNMALADMMHDGLRAVVFRSIVVAQKNQEDQYAGIKDEFKEFSDNLNQYLKNIAESEVDDETKKNVVLS